MKTYDIEYVARVHLTIPVQAESAKAAQLIADQLLPRHPVIAEPARGAPKGASVVIGTRWELNYNGEAYV